MQFNTQRTPRGAKTPQFAQNEVRLTNRKSGAWNVTKSRLHKRGPAIFLKHLSVVEGIRFSSTAARSSCMRRSISCPEMDWPFTLLTRSRKLSSMANWVSCVMCWSVRGRADRQLTAGVRFAGALLVAVKPHPGDEADVERDGRNRLVGQ